MRINEILAMLGTSNEQKAMNEALAQYGSQSREYRRAWRRQYRKNTHRVDYYPDRSAAKALDMAMANGWALSQSDAINQALVAWAEWIAEDDCPE
jgi:hypothetical protein